MFTGIIEAIGIVRKIENSGSNQVFWIQSPISPEMAIDQSISHNGVCLTVEAVDNDLHRVTAIAETLKKTTMGQWSAGTPVNLERCLQVTGRLDGHFVQGHIDGTATCTNKTDLSGSWEFRFKIPDEFAHLIIEKGSIAINGTSLTIFAVSANEFSVAIIPYTYNNTTISTIGPGDVVNIEFDIIGKYINRRIQLSTSK